MKILVIGHPDAVLGFSLAGVGGSIATNADEVNRALDEAHAMHEAWQQLVRGVRQRQLTPAASDTVMEEEAVRRALRKDRAQRVATAAELGSLTLLPKTDSPANAPSPRRSMPAAQPMPGVGGPPISSTSRS